MSEFTEIQYFIENKEVFPEGKEAIGVTIDLTTDFSELELTVDSLTFAREGKSLILSIQNNIGLQAAIPILIKIETIEEEFVLSPKKTYQEEDDYITIGIEKRYGLGRLMKRANGTNWDQVNLKKAITGASNIPYRVVDPNPGSLLITLFIQEVSLTLALYDKIRAIANAISSILGGASGFAESAAQLITEAIHTALMIAAWIITTKKTFRVYFPKKRYLYENKLYNLVRLGVEHLGYTLSSNLLSSYSNMGVIAVPLQETNQSVLGDVFNGTDYFNGKYPSSLDTIPTVGKAIQAVKTMFDARMMIIGNVLHIESDEFFKNQPTQTIQTTLNDQEKLVNRKGFNFDEGWSHKLISYDVDSSDRYTLDKIKGVRADYGTKYIGSSDLDLVDIEGSENIEIPFVLGKRKDNLSYFEQQAYIVASVIDIVINGFGGNSNLSGEITGSIGELIISDDHFVKTKLIWSVGGKQTANYIDKIGAKAIYQKNHTQNQVKENFRAIEECEVPFSIEQFKKLLNSYYVNDEFNTQLKVSKYSWLPSDTTMTIEYSIDASEKSKTETILLHG